jgi:hypothetical protein
VSNRTWRKKKILTKIFVSAAASLVSIAILTPSAAVAQRVASNVPNGIRQASDLGRVDPTKEINITVQLRLQNQAAFDKAVDALYEPGSPTFTSGSPMRT